MWVISKTESKPKSAKKLTVRSRCQNILFCRCIFAASRFGSVMFCSNLINDACKQLKELEQLKRSPSSKNATANNFSTKHKKRSHMF